MKGLQLTVNWTTGERAGGLDPRDRRTRCHPAWQDSDGEVRVVVDEAVLTDIDTRAAGVRVLDGDAAIDAAVDALADPPRAISDSHLVVEHMRQRGQTFDDYTDAGGRPLDGAELADALAADGIVGVSQPPVRPRAADVAGRQASR